MGRRHKTCLQLSDPQTKTVFLRTLDKKLCFFDIHLDFFLFLPRNLPNNLLCRWFQFTSIPSIFMKKTGPNEYIIINNFHQNTYFFFCLKKPYCCGQGVSTHPPPPPVYGHFRNYYFLLFLLLPYVLKRNYIMKKSIRCCWRKIGNSAFNIAWERKK